MSYFSKYRLSIFNFNSSVYLLEVSRKPQANSFCNKILEYFKIENYTVF